MKRATRTLLLSGFMGSGKSTVGRLVAARTGSVFVDLDDLIETGAGLSTAEIFAQEGEIGFRRREKALLEQVVAADAEQVVALGGGALLDRASRLAALERAFVLTLTADTETLVQ